MKVLEAIEEKDRLILSNKKTAFETNKKLSYTVRLAAALAPHDQWTEHLARRRLSDGDRFSEAPVVQQWSSHA